MTRTAIRNSILLLILCLGSLLGCTSPDESVLEPSHTITHTVTSTSTQLPTATQTPSPTPTPLPLNGQQTQYDIDLTVNYYNRFITVTSRAQYTNKTTTPLNEILFIVYPTIFQDAIYIKSIKLGDGSAVNNFRWDGHRMIIPLDEPLLPGEQIEFIHDLELYMPNREGVFGQTGQQLNLSYWFPFIPPYNATEGWVAHDIQWVNSFFIGEFLVFEPADFNIVVQFTDRRENFKIAANTLPQEEDGKIHFKSTLARTFTLSISDSFLVTEREFNGIKIQSFAFTADADVGEVVADVAKEALSLYSELYGDYDRDVLSIVEFNADIGMEFDGLIFLSFAFYNLYPGNPQSNIHVYTAHEIAHQWFFSQVGNDQALEPWLDEAFATYSESLFYERFYPEYLTWWWENYITSHNPSGYIDISIYFGGDLFEYRDIVYRNGALFLQDLRDIIGDDAFFAFLKCYVGQFRYQIVTSKDFWTLLSQHTDADLSLLQNEYFESSPSVP